MQEYLAQVDKQRLSRGRLHLVMKRHIRGTWTSILPMETIPLPSDYHHLNEGLLVLLDLDARQAKNITPALTDLIRILQDMSFRMLQYQKQEEDIKLWRESLEFQATQLFARTEDFERREELLKFREVQVFELLKKMN